MLKINLETFSLNQLPETEDDFFEFKSSLTALDEAGELKKNFKNELIKKLTCAVSGFANSGGGCFVGGVGRNGNADNGLPLKIGEHNLREHNLRDWVDQIIHQVEPVPQYEIKLIQDSEGRGIIKPDSAVLIVAVHESYVGPHMAPDNRYYIRAGAHTVSAKHFIVDAIWAKRHFSKPRLTHLFRLKPDQQASGTIQLGILAITSSPAVDVKITLSPFPELIKNRFNFFPIHLFPLNLPVIDQNNPFFFDVGIVSKEHFEDDIYFEIDYCDLAGNTYNYKTKLVVEGLLPRILGKDNLAKIVTNLELINKSLKEMTISREAISKPNIVLSKPTEKAFLKLEKMIPELLASMKEDLLESPFAREFIIVYKGKIYEGDENNLILYYCFEDHSFLRNKLRLLENHQLIYEITYNSAPRFVMSEELANYLLDSQLE
jgi:hypothetical protein